MENDLEKLRWLEYQLKHSTEESLAREFDQIEREMLLEGVDFPDPPEEFFQEIIRRGRELVKARLAETWEDRYGEFEERCPICGGILHIVNRELVPMQGSQMKFRCDNCDFSYNWN